MIPTELQIEIDDIYSCLGCCNGCALTGEERLFRGPSMTRKTLSRIYDRLDEYIPTIEGLKDINITYGIADHLLMPADYVSDLYALASRLITSRNGVDGQVFFTASLVGNQSEIKEKLSEIHDHVGKVRLIPIVVLDPEKYTLSHYGKRYSATFDAAYSIFGRIDLTLNLSVPAIESLPAEELHRFVVDHGFHDVTINWTPTMDNIDSTASSISAVKDWLVSFYRLASDSGSYGFSYKDVIQKAVRLGSEFTHDERRDSISRMLCDTVSRSLQFDHEGNVMAKFEAIGDVPHGRRWGLMPMGNVNDGPLADTISGSLARMASYVMGGHALFKACAECEYDLACMSTGFHIYNHVLVRTGKADRGHDQCPHVAKSLFAMQSSAAIPSA